MDLAQALRNRVWSSKNDDFSGKFNHYYGVTLLLMISAIISTKNLTGEPIHCWCPDDFTADMVRYAEETCFSSGNFSVVRRDEHVKVIFGEMFHWMMVGSLLLALTFRLPYVVWCRTCSLAQLNVTEIIDWAVRAARVEPGHVQQHNRQVILHYFAKYRSLAGRSGGGPLAKAGRKLQSLPTMYLLVKLLYFVNTLAQVVLVEYLMMQQTDLSFSWIISRDIFAVVRNLDSTLFPRSVMCRFSTREPGHHTARHAVQCILPINRYAHILFGAYWFFLLAATLVNFGGILKWVWYLQLRYVHAGYILLLLRDAKLPDNGGEFIDDYLGYEGVFVIRLVADNTSDIVVKDLVNSLFDDFQSAFPR